MYINCYRARANEYYLESRKFELPELKLLIDAVESAIYDRLPFAESFAPYTSNRDRRYPYYRIQVKNFTIFYVVIDNVMEVRRILYGKRNWTDHI